MENSKQCLSIRRAFLLKPERFSIEKVFEENAPFPNWLIFSKLKITDFPSFLSRKWRKIPFNRFFTFKTPEC